MRFYATEVQKSDEISALNKVLAGVAIVIRTREIRIIHELLV